MENSWYKEQIKFQQKKLYGKSSEKTNDDQLELLLVFDEAEIESTPFNDETDIQVMTHSRKKKSKQMSLDSLDNKVIHYELTEDELDCPTCRNKMHEMSKHVRKELIFVPAKVEVLNHVEHIYSCRNCEMHSDEATIIKANSPNPLIKGSLVSSSLLASIINDKYDKSLPLYRQKVSFNRLGINVNRQNMSNWLIKVSNDK